MTDFAEDSGFIDLSCVLCGHLKASHMLVQGRCESTWPRMPGKLVSSWVKVHGVAAANRMAKSWRRRHGNSPCACPGFVSPEVPLVTTGRLGRCLK